MSARSPSNVSTAPDSTTPDCASAPRPRCTPCGGGNAPTGSPCQPRRATGVTTGPRRRDPHPGLRPTGLLPRMPEPPHHAAGGPALRVDHRAVVAVERGGEGPPAYRAPHHRPTGNTSTWMRTRKGACPHEIVRPRSAPPTVLGSHTDASRNRPPDSITTTRPCRGRRAAAPRTRQGRNGHSVRASLLASRLVNCAGSRSSPPSASSAMPWTSSAVSSSSWLWPFLS